MQKQPNKYNCENMAKKTAYVPVMGQCEEMIMKTCNCVTFLPNL